jgi:hypothetical protein
MKAFISKLIIAGILSITLVAVTDTIPHLSHKYQAYRSAKLSSVQSVQEMPDGSYGNLVNTLFSSTVR